MNYPLGGQFPSDAEVTSALDAVSVTRWLWSTKRDRGESADAIDEAQAAYERARTVLIDLLQREAEDDVRATVAQTSHGVPFGPTAPKYRRLPEPANGNGGDAD